MTTKQLISTFGSILGVAALMVLQWYGQAADRKASEQSESGWVAAVESLRAEVEVNRGALQRAGLWPAVVTPGGPAPAARLPMLGDPPADVVDPPADVEPAGDATPADEESAELEPPAEGDEPPALPDPPRAKIDWPPLQRAY